jgi:hypothetical protein
MFGVQELEVQTLRFRDSLSASIHCLPAMDINWPVFPDYSAVTHPNDSIRRSKFLIKK